ncbi:MAG: hypothetical protein GY716_25490 [bacterium]|nr:hypothetical protein [bacterium]
MTDEPIFEGKDLEQALAAAAQKLGIPEDDLDYKMMDTGRRGIFGIGARSVRIRIMPPLHEELPQPPQPPQALQAPQAPPPQEPRRRKSAAPARAAKAEGDAQARTEVGAESKPSGRSRNRRRGRRSGRRTRSGAGSPAAIQPEAAPREAERPAREENAPRAAAGTVPAEQLQNLEEKLTRILELMQLEIETKTAVEGGEISIELEGDDVKRLTNKNADGMAALQFLLNRMARRSWDGVERIRVSGSRRKRRDADLVELTREVAQQVTQTGKSKRLHPMNAYERRLVHLTAREIDGVDSRSEGRGSKKTVRIFRQEEQAGQADS